MPHAGAGGDVVGKRAGVSRSLAKLPVCAREAGQIRNRLP